jgi:peptidoglycan-associated lipoprotein
MSATFRNSILMTALLVAGATACRKPAPAPQPEPAKAAPAPAPAPAPVAQVQKTDDSAAKAAADAEAARLAAEAAYKQAAAAALKDVHFEYDKSTVMDSDKPVLEGIAAFLKNYPQANVAIDGNCDERGTVEYNLALGERRAHAALDYLVSLGVPAARLSAISFGKEKPVCTESAESCWSQNRRAHFSLK